MSPNLIILCSYYPNWLNQPIRWTMHHSYPLYHDTKPRIAPLSDPIIMNDGEWFSICHDGKSTQARIMNGWHDGPIKSPRGRIIIQRWGSRSRHRNHNKLPIRRTCTGPWKMSCSQKRPLQERKKCLSNSNFGKLLNRGKWWWAPKEERNQDGCGSTWANL